MTTIEKKSLIQNISYYRQVLHLISKNYNLGRVDFEVLCTCSALEKPRQPYFFVKDVIERQQTISKNGVYTVIKKLMEMGFIKASYRTKSRIQADFYMVTGNGESVLRFYTSKMNQLS